jgi:hypothetical protein
MIDRLGLSRALRVRSCLTSTVCSESLDVFLDWANDDTHVAHADYESFDMSITAYRGIGENGSVPSRIALTIALRYLPTFGQSLRDNDRATLTLTDETGAEILNATSEFGYVDSPHSQSDPPCRALALGLDGRSQAQSP